MKVSSSTVATGLALLATHTSAQSCGPAPSGSIKPSIASGYSMQVVATGLSKPRGIMLDQAGNLLVVEQGRGVISAHTLKDNKGCVSIASSSDVTPSMNVSVSAASFISLLMCVQLNHGIEMSTDGKTLYASTSEEVFSWTYNQQARTVSNNRTLVNNMAGSDHTTRTLLLSRKSPGTLVVTRGSTSNIDFDAASLNSGHSQIRAFDIGNQAAAVRDFNTAGTRLGWGLRNDVGIAEHPNSGGIYSVENSADQLTRMGVDIHEWVAPKFHTTPRNLCAVYHLLTSIQR
jgi:glucose/arabinose dehydrogenase